jgi:hypothetical protein
MSVVARHHQPRPCRSGYTTAAACLATMASVVMLTMGATASGRFGALRVLEAGAIHASPLVVGHEPACGAATADSEIGASPSTRTHPLVLAADRVGISRTRAVSLSRMGSLYGP